MRKHVVVIVLGLGEGAALYQFLTRNWERSHGLTPQVHVIGWKMPGELDTRLHQLHNHIKKLNSEGHTVSLIGISAGASISLLAYIKCTRQDIPIRTFTSLCGRFNLSHHWWYPLSYGVQRFPIFEQSVTKTMQCVQRLTKKQKASIYCLRSIFDEVVPRSASTLLGSPSKMMLLPGHHLGIYAAFLFPKQLLSLMQRSQNAHYTVAAKQK